MGNAFGSEGEKGPGIAWAFGKHVLLKFLLFCQRSSFTSLIS